ncbi:MAG: hypothetical protein ACOYK8_09725 [Alphaproteobacteria bacterium]
MESIKPVVGTGAAPASAAAPQSLPSRYMQSIFLQEVVDSAQAIKPGVSVETEINLGTPVKLFLNLELPLTVEQAQMVGAAHMVGIAQALVNAAENGHVAEISLTVKGMTAAGVVTYCLQQGDSQTPAIHLAVNVDNVASTEEAKKAALKRIQEIQQQINQAYLRKLRDPSSNSPNQVAFLLISHTASQSPFLELAFEKMKNG